MAKAKVLKIPARGEWEFAEVETESDGSLALETMQSLVGGDIERWCLQCHGLDGLDLFLDEEGKLKGRSYNPKATLLSMILMHGDCIVGDAFVCSSDDEGNSVDPTDYFGEEPEETEDVIEDADVVEDTDVAEAEDEK